MVPERKGDRKTVCIDLSNTHKDLGWSARVRLEDHLSQFMQSIKSE